MDKTNSHQLISLEKYKNWCNSHLSSQAVKTPFNHLSKVEEEANMKLKQIKNILSPSEFAYMKHTINK